MDADDLAIYITIRNQIVAAVALTVEKKELSSA